MSMKKRVKKPVARRNTNSKKPTAEQEAERLLNVSSHEIHEGDFHQRQSAWNKVTSSEGGKLNGFTRVYMDSLGYKSLRQRLSFIEYILDRHEYRSFKVISGQEVERAMDEELRLRKSQKLYVKYQDSMYIIIQLGEREIQEGMNIAAAHIDSPALVSTGSIRQNFNVATMPCTVRGGLVPKDVTNRDFYLHYYGFRRRNGSSVKTEFTIGQNARDPVFNVAEASMHMDIEEQRKVMIKDLEMIIGSRPFPARGVNPRQNRKLGVMKLLNDKHGITEQDLRDAEITFLPLDDPRFVGADRSLISAYGQDNWACAFSLLWGFLKTKRPQYTKMLVLYDKEETRDAGRGSISTNFINSIIVPAIARTTKKEAADEWEMLRNTWSLYADATEPISVFNPDQHDPYSTTYVGSGVVLNDYGGGKGNEGGYEASPEMKRAMRTLFERKNIAHQFGIMGTHEDPIPGSSDAFHSCLLLSQGVDIGIPLLGMHRMKEIVSVIDLWNLYKTAIAFFSVSDHDKYWPKEK